MDLHLYISRRRDIDILSVAEATVFPRFSEFTEFTEFILTPARFADHISPCERNVFLSIFIDACLLFGRDSRESFRLQLQVDTPPASAANHSST